MGAWGPGIFSNDTASDVREEWRGAILDGAGAEEASARMVARWAPSLGAGGATQTEFWTGLAAAQMETGRLQPDVRDHALTVIAAGGDVALWDEGGGGRARERALARLAEKLRGPQPAPKRLRRPPPAPDPGVELGDVLRVDAPDRSRAALFCVVDFEESRAGRSPVLLGLHWAGGPVPGAEELAALPFLSAVDTSSFEGDELPDYVDGAAPLLVTVLVDRRDGPFGPHAGEFVARGVRRECPGPSGTMTDFAGLQLIVGEELELCLEATRRRLEKYGDDPRPWETAHAEYLATARPFIEQMQGHAGLDPRDFGLDER